MLAVYSWVRRQNPFLSTAAAVVVVVKQIHPGNTCRLDGGAYRLESGRHVVAGFSRHGDGRL